MPDTLRNEPDVLTVPESRNFRSYQGFLRACRDYMTGPLLGDMKEYYQEALENETLEPSTDDVMRILDDSIEFQIYSWANRHLQRLKYQDPELGVFATVNAHRESLIAELDAAASDDPECLQLNPNIEFPEYYKMVDFHQHTGGVWSDELDGVAYEFGRRTTNAVDVDPDVLYRMSYSQFPDRRYEKVLDWGTGHGAGLIEWQKLHPESECHGVDLSAPCLKLAHKRAKELGLRMHFSQQDVEHLEYDDNTFDAVFHLFMFHELPPVTLKNALREVLRVLKPGGIFVGPEIGLSGKDPFMDVVWLSHAWSNNEPFSAQWFKFDIERAANDVGFSRVTIEPFKPMYESNGESKPNDGRWRFYTLEK